MTKHKQEALSYADAGVDIAAGNALVEKIKPAVKSTARTGVIGGIGGFGGLFDLKANGYNDPLLVAATDGVGTKLLLAQAAESYDTVGIDLVAMCVNDLIVQGAEPLFFLDYYACGTLETDAATRVIAGIAQGCKIAGCALIGGETAEMPGLYTKGEYDLAGFSVGAVERDGVYPHLERMQEGDVVIGLASSGVHSNGYSLVRKIVEREAVALDAPAPFDESVTLSEALLAPTRIYVKPCLEVLKTGNVHALAHVTGGGLLENIPRILPDEFGVEIDLSAMPLSPLFAWLKQSGNLSDDEMLRTFNCGFGMALIAKASEQEAIIAQLNAAGETAKVIGHVTAREGDEAVRITASW